MKRWMAALATLCLLAPLLAHAGDGPVGSIKTATGAASIIRNHAAVEAKVGTRVFCNDSLKTGADGTLALVFKDDTLISIGPNSEVTISDFAFSPAEGKLSIITRLMRGTAAYVSGIIAKLSPESVRFETPVASIGIRGTKFAVHVEEKDN